MRVYAPDLPGHGPSNHDARPLSVPELAEALARWMDARRLSSVLLIGHSLGCHIAAELAARRADLVSAVLLIGPTSDASARTLPHHLGRALVSSPFDRPGYLIGALLDYWRAGPRLLVGEMRAMLRHRIEDVLPRVTAPAQVVRGGRDFLSPDAWAATVAEGLGSPPLITIPGWGHAVHYDAPAAIAAIATSMLAHTRPVLAPE
jgi:pimeloyl-ACP methyl ester carboxylesterase